MNPISTPTASSGYQASPTTLANVAAQTGVNKGNQMYGSSLNQSPTPTAPVTPPTLPSIPSPVVGTTSTPNAVFSSSAAKSDFASKQAAGTQLQQSMADQTAYKNEQTRQQQLSAAQDTVNNIQTGLAQLKASMAKGGDQTTPPPSVGTQATTSGPTPGYLSGQVQDSVNAGDQLAQAHSELAKQALNGTIPLSTTQQAILNNLQSTNQQLINQQQIANKNYTAGVTATGIASGRSRYAPEIEQGNIQNAVNVGIQKIADLNAKNAETMAKLTEGFEQNNYKIINDEYANLAAQNKEKTSVLLDLQGKQQQALESARNYNRQVAQDDINNKLNSDKFTFDQKNEAFNQAMKSAEFTEKQKNDLADRYYKQQDLAIRQAEQNIKQRTFNADYGAFVDSSGQPSDFKPESIPGVTKTDKGITYFDPSNVNPKQALAAENAARKAGITIIDKADAPIVKGLSNSIDKLSQVEDAFNKIATPNIPGASLVQGGANLVGKATQAIGYETQYQQNVDAYNSARSGLIQLASSLSSGGSRSIGTVLNRIEDLIPASTVGIVPGNEQGAKAKFTEARKLIYDSIRTYVPTARLPQSGDIVYPTLSAFATAHPELKDAAKKLQALHPDWSETAYLKTLNN